jgi:hypothetical protein
MQRITDNGQVDEQTKVFRVQWYDDGVLLSCRIDGDADWTRIHLPISGARHVAAAILQCVDERDALLIALDKIRELPETDEPEPRDTTDLVVLADFLVADPWVVRELHACGIAHLPVRLRDGTGLVGPLVVPGVMSCLDEHKG